MGDQLAHLVQPRIQHVLAGRSARVPQPDGRLQVRRGASGPRPRCRYIRRARREGDRWAASASNSSNSAVLGRNLGAHVAVRVTSEAALGWPDNGNGNGPQQRVGQLERGGLGYIETVDQPMADQVKIAGHRGAGLTVLRAKRCTSCVGSPWSAKIARRGIVGEGALEPRHLARAARGHIASRASGPETRTAAARSSRRPGRENRPWARPHPP